LAFPPPPSTSITHQSPQYNLLSLLFSYPCPNSIYFLATFIKTLKSVGFYFFNLYILFTVYFLTLFKPVSEMGSSSKVNPVRNSTGALNPAGIILKSNPAAKQWG